MSPHNPYMQYTNTAVITASKEQLTMMLYEGALKFASQAVLALDENKLLMFNETIRRTLDIVRELQNTLDLKPKNSANIYALYDYIIERLLVANTDKNREALLEARNLLKDFRDMWSEAMALDKKQQTS